MGPAKIFPVPIWIRNRPGFSLLELIVVLVLIAMVAATVVVRWSGLYQGPAMNSAVAQLEFVDAHKLRAVTEAQEIYEHHSQQDPAIVNDAIRSEMLDMATNFPSLWNDSRTSNRDRKKIVRLLIEDVTLKYDTKIELHVRFKGGTSQSLELAKPLSAWELHQTSKEVLQTIDLLLNEFTEGQIAEKLNERGLRSGKGSTFTANLVGKIRRTYQLASRYERLRKAGLLTQRELAQQLDIHPQTIRRWRNSGLLQSQFYNDKNEALYEPLNEDHPIKLQGIKLTDPRRKTPLAIQRTDEVQREA